MSRKLFWGQAKNMTDSPMNGPIFTRTISNAIIKGTLTQDILIHLHKVERREAERQKAE
jgi:hypothetical protein